MRAPLRWIAVGTALLAASGAIGACSSSQADHQPWADSRGEQIFVDNCAKCHGRNGGGGQAPALAGVTSERFPTVEDQIAFVEQGNFDMPSFRDILTPEDMRTVVEYTRSLPPHDPAQ